MTFNFDKYTPAFWAQYLTMLGYCKVSTKYRIISRIDKPEWLTVLRDAGVLSPLYLDRQLPSIADHYRRVYSKCTIEGVPPEIFQQLPTSCHNTDTQAINYQIPITPGTYHKTLGLSALTEQDPCQPVTVEISSSGSGKSKMSRDRVQFVAPYHLCAKTAGRELLMEHFGLSKAAVEQGAESDWGILIRCRPSQFARFLIARHAVGLKNGFIELEAKLLTPAESADSLRQYYDCSKVPARYAD